MWISTDHREGWRFPAVIRNCSRVRSPSRAGNSLEPGTRSIIPKCHGESPSLIIAAFRRILSARVWLPKVSSLDARGGVGCRGYYLIQLQHFVWYKNGIEDAQQRIILTKNWHRREPNERHIWSCLKGPRVFSHRCYHGSQSIGGKHANGAVTTLYHFRR